MPDLSDEQRTASEPYCPAGCDDGQRPCAYPSDCRRTRKPRRILVRANYPEGEAPELDWINSEVRLLGKSFGRACRDIEADIAAGYMIVVRTE